MSMKNPLTPAGIEPATFQFLAQHLNHCALPLIHKFTPSLVRGVPMPNIISPSLYLTQSQVLKSPLYPFSDFGYGIKCGS
jgi:hypothetical protein